MAGDIKFMPVCHKWNYSANGNALSNPLLFYIILSVRLFCYSQS